MIRVAVFVAGLCLAAAIPYTGDQTAEDGNSFRDEESPFSDMRDSLGNTLKAPMDVQNPISASKMGFSDVTEQLKSFSPASNNAPSILASNEIDNKDSAYTISDVIRPAQEAAQDAMENFAKQAGNLGNLPNLPEMKFGDAKGFANMDLSNPDALANPMPIVPPMNFPVPPISFDKIQSHMPTDKIAEKSFSEVAGLPSMEHIFQSLDDKVNAARTVWDRIMGQSDIQEETKVGIERTSSAIADAELTSQAVKAAGEKAQSSVAADHDTRESASSASDLTRKVVQDDLEVQEAAKEAKRWVDKVLEKSAQASVDSGAAEVEMERAKKLADETLARDMAVQEQMKDVLVESNRAIQEANDAKEKLLQLQKHEEWVMKDAAEAKESLLEVKKEEQELREQEEKLRNLLVSEEAAKAHAESELQALRATTEKQLEEMRAEKTRLESEKQSEDTQLKNATTELEHARNDAELKQKEIELLERSTKEQQQQQSEMLKQALEDSRQAKEQAASALAKEKEAEAKAERLAQEKEFIQKKMQETLQEAKRRTKEWLHSQIDSITAQDSAKDAEINRLHVELEKLEKEERERRGLDLAVAQQQLEALHSQEKIQAQLQAQMDNQKVLQQQAVAAAVKPVKQVLTQEPSAMTNLELAESAKPMPTKEQVYAQMLAAHDRVKRLLLGASEALLPAAFASSTPVTPSAPASRPVHVESAAMDLEQIATKLSRRKNLSPRTVDALPLGYPPPHGTSKMHAEDMTNLEIDEGTSQTGHGSPLSAQGVNSDVPIISKYNQDNCLKICSGGDATVYRDGVVSTDPTDAHTVHTPGACMRLCAMFTIDAKNCSQKPEGC
eukprot:c45535_g1_i1.p1 GENE.c45535_g1_i1~~c45535_g1_i1.p1  ORF type:complete len:851 (+),score=247.73 c45535_g1_i1:29-2554(+)